ncbi:MAG: hypothetical protein WD768_04585 [Phycisphaeraceae bacterium]
MWKRFFIPLLLLAALVFGTLRFLSWREGVRQHEQRVHERNIDGGSPLQRVYAADYLLRTDSDNERLRFIRAESLIALFRYRDGRQELRGLLERRTPQTDRAANLIVESYFQEAESVIHRADTTQFNLAINEVLELMDGVEANRQFLSKTGNELRLTNIDGRRFDALVRIHSVGLDDRRVGLARAQIAGLNETIERLSIEVAELTRKVNAYGDELVATCEKALKLDPVNARAMELLFMYRLRQRRFDQAREMAGRIAALEELSADSASRVANELLDLEARYGQVVTEQDMDLAARLLERPQFKDQDEVNFIVARTALALSRNDPAKAEQFALPYLKHDPLYSRLRVLWAIARIQQGDVDSAVRYLGQYSERQRDARTLYALGMAYLAQGRSHNITLGHESLRQSLETEPNFLPARLALIESRIRRGFTFEAADDILIADRINPLHPRVKAAKAMLAVQTLDLGTLASLLESQITDESSMTGDMVTLAAVMVLDDVIRARALAQALSASHPHHALALVAIAWCEQEAKNRPLVASAVLRTLIQAVEADPMQRVKPLNVPAFALLKMGAIAPISDTTEVVRQIRLSHFQPRPLEAAARLVKSALDHWPQDDGLIRTAAELNLWLQQPEAARVRLTQRRPGTDIRKTPLDHAIEAWAAKDWPRVITLLAERPAQEQEGDSTFQRLDLALAISNQSDKAITDSLTRLLTAHPWAEEALLTAVADALGRNQPDRAYALLGVADVINPKVAHLSRGRMNLALGRASEALQSSELIVNDVNLDSELRRWAMEIRARAHIALEQDAIAAGMFDQLGAAMKAHGTDLKMRSVDVYLLLGKKYAAAEVLSQLLATPELSPWLRDQLLARGLLVMNPSRLRASVEAVLVRETNDLLLLAYQAKTAAEEDVFVAENMLKSLLIRRPGSPRTLFIQASVVRRFQPDQARAIYEKLSAYPGSVGQAARDAIMEMEQPAAPSSRDSSPANEEGSPQ